MHKRIILPILTACLILLTSCSDFFSVTTSEVSSPKNTNSSNSTKVDKNKIEDDIKLSPYYSRLELGYGFETLTTDSQRRLYFDIIGSCRAITDAVDEDAPRKSYFMEPFTIYNCSLTDLEIAHARAAVFMDNPQIFWLDSYYTYSYSGSTFTLTLQSTMSKSEYERKNKQLNAVISDILSGLRSGMSDYERELYLHDYLVKNCNYIRHADDSVDDNPYTAYGCLVNQTAVCEGYTKAFQLLLMCCDVPSVTVKGSVQESTVIDHIWNAVKIGGSWYHTDVTWDDTEDVSMYDFFNQTEAVFKMNHLFSPLVSEASEEELKDENDSFIAFNIFIPECNQTEYNYYRREGSELKDLYNNTLVDDLTSAATLGKAYFYIYVNTNYLNFNDVYYQLFSQDVYGFSDYIRSANSNLGYDAIALSATVVRKDSLNVIAVEIKYN